MNHKDKPAGNQDVPDRRSFLRKFLKKSAPMIVGAVAKKVASRPVASVAALVPSSSGLEKKETSPVPPDEVQKEMEQSREEFLKDNPDYFESP